MKKVSVFLALFVLLLGSAAGTAKAESFGPVTIEAIADAMLPPYRMGQVDLKITVNEDLESLTIYSYTGFQHSVGTRMLYIDKDYKFLFGRQELAEKQTCFLYDLKAGDKVILKLKFLTLTRGEDTWLVTAVYPSGETSINVTWQVTNRIK
ncbi:MAG: hypothetical protein HYV90_03480 [Candidatus Woesebacteria bacterium]|nr:MAG: hypothetical protein HYV90_03480 [Candidatus Woesebacteria bacterium]